MSDLKHKIESLQGPILVLGASGFIGANILRTLLKYRYDVHGTFRKREEWRDYDGKKDRLREILVQNLIPFNMLNDKSFSSFVENAENPRTVLDCLAYGSYPFQTETETIRITNVWNKTLLVSELIGRGMKHYIHAGTSSEYGTNSTAPEEWGSCYPTDEYGRSKLMWSKMMTMCSMSYISRANLRLYSVYGPYEDGSRLIPQVIQHGVRGEYPPFVRSDISRDFVYVDDVVEAFVDAALNLKPEDYGGSFNIGTGIKTRIMDLALLAAVQFNIAGETSYTMPPREWDHCNDWYANPTKARERLGWQYKTSLAEGIDKTVQWYKSQGEGWEWPTIKPPTA